MLLVKECISLSWAHPGPTTIPPHCWTMERQHQWTTQTDTRLKILIMNMYRKQYTVITINNKLAGLRSVSIRTSNVSLRVEEALVWSVGHVCSPVEPAISQQPC